MSLKAEIHDLGYKRYDGPRNPASQRWRVILRYQLHYAWQTWWRYKLALALAVVATFVFGTLIYVLRSKTMTEFDKAGVTVRFVDFMVFTAIGVYVKLAFIVTMTMTALTIANDERTGALVFYFVRSTRPIDYVIGRFLGLCLLNGVLLMAGPLLLVLLRIGLADAGEDTLTNLMMIPKILLLTGLATAAFSAVPLAFSAMSKNQWTGFALWAGWYIMGGQIVALLGLMVSGPVGALDLAVATTQGALKLLDIAIVIPGQRGNSDVAASFVPLWASLVSLGAQAAAGLALATLKLKRSQGDVAGGS